MPLSREPAPLSGLSGELHRFDFRFGDELVDAIGPSKASSAPEIRKLVDLRMVSDHKATTFRVIVDDRTRPDLAASEISILGRLCTAWPMSALIKASHHSAAQH